MKRNTTGIIVVLLAAAFAPHAEEYHLDSLIEIAMKNASGIAKAKLDVQSAEATTRIAYYGLLPQATASYSRGGNYVTAMSSSEIAGVGVSKTLSLANNDLFAIRKSRLSAREADLSLEANRKQLAYRIFDQYLQVLQAQEELQIQQEQLEIQTKTNDKTKLLYEQKRISGSDLANSGIELMNAQIELENARNGLAVLREDLFFLLKMSDQGHKLAVPQIPVWDAKALAAKLAAAETIPPTLSMQLRETAIDKNQIIRFQNRLNYLPDHE